jgi:subtilisin family serine protease
MARRSRTRKTPKGSRRIRRARRKRVAGARLRARAAQVDVGLHIHKLGIDDAPSSLGAKTPKTVIYIHGIGNKPIASVLKCQWDQALFGERLGDRSRMAYWVNRRRYPVPLPETCEDGDKVTESAAALSVRTMATAAPLEPDALLDNQVRAITDDAGQQAVLRRIGRKMLERSHASANAAIRAQDIRAKVIPLPPWIRDRIAGQLTSIFLADVHDFLYEKDLRAQMERTLLDRMAAGGGPFVVVAHSQGTMIVYDVLRRLSRAQFQVPLFVTIGSPLGLTEVQDELRRWSGAAGKLPFPPCIDKWVNVADRLDPVAVENDISGDFTGAIENHSGLGVNRDGPFHPHSATGYLRNETVRTAVREEVGSSFDQAIASFAIARDLVDGIEDGHGAERHPALIQLSDLSGAPSQDASMARRAAAVEAKIAEMLAATGEHAAAAKVDRLRHFVAADLTRLEIETLRSYFRDLEISVIWRNASKRALINDSTNTLQVHPANLGYGADGKDISWAVLDTGIRADHPHFAESGNVVAQWDCTEVGAPVRLKPKSQAFNELDRDGHGTHVAGIIAGRFKLADGTLMAGMAPRCKLYGFKVLNDQGEGQDSWIIKAIDLVTQINEKAGSLVIQGMNLSLGGNFDPSVFGCGHTPLCQELRRLWRQGVVVCLAAGNDGYAVLKGEEDDIQANMALSIGDPANLEESIAIGSVHKTNPNTYGISYFSSRGPTADGRRKPDVVAPGERILSARHDWKIRRRGAYERDDLYVEMSGTSMASPHVSGLLASFLSLRKEFIAYPDRVKEMLLASCVDLRRDQYIQGAGLPNLIKMLALN